MKASFPTLLQQAAAKSPEDYTADLNGPQGRSEFLTLVSEKMGERETVLVRLSTAFLVLLNFHSCHHKLVECGVQSNAEVTQDKRQFRIQFYSFKVLCHAIFCCTSKYQFFTASELKHVNEILCKR